MKIEFKPAQPILLGKRSEVFLDDQHIGDWKLLSTYMWDSEGGFETNEKGMALLGGKQRFGGNENDVYWKIQRRVEQLANKTMHLTAGCGR